MSMRGILVFAACLAWAQAGEKSGEVYQARHALRKAAASTQELEVLRRAAEVEDTFGQSAAASYAALAAALEKSSPHSPDYRRALERGLEVSLRDEDLDKAAWFRDRLAGAADTAFSGWLESKGTIQREGVWVPGGLEAAAFLLHARWKPSPERFFLDFSRALLGRAMVSQPAILRGYQESIRDHFARVAALEALGRRNGNRVTISLSVGDDRSRQHTEQVLNLLGWRMRASKDAVKLDVGEKAAQAKRQETTSALAIDEVGMQEALEAGKPFRFEIVDEWAVVTLGERPWREAFYPKESPAGGLTEALARDTRLLKLYAGLSAMDRRSAALLASSAGLKNLAEKYGDRIQQFAAALAVEDGRAAVPGGERAEALWAKLAGSSPREPAKFFQALLDQEDGRLLAFFFTLSQLDTAHQRFFTANAARMKQFYELFSAAPEHKQGVVKPLGESSFFEFLRDVPLEGDARIRFPGGAAAWTAEKAGAGASEEEILLRLAQGRYMVGRAHHSELDRFLAVNRIEAHRRTPLDAASVRLLARHFTEYQAAYPYFAILTGLAAPEFEQFFALGEKLRPLPKSDLNLVLGQVHALIEVLCLAQQSGRLDERRSAALLGLLCNRFLRAKGPADWTRASLDMVRQILAGLPQPEPDEAMRNLLLGPEGTPEGAGSAVAFEIQGVLQQVDDPVRDRHAKYRKVLELQKTPSLGALLALYDAATRLAAGKGTPADIQTVEASGRQLVNVDAGNLRRTRLKPRDLGNFRADRFAATVAGLRATPNNAPGLADQLLAAINPQVKVALTGIIYACFLSPADLLVSDDASLVRKHQFADLRTTFRLTPLMAPADLIIGGALGSFVIGGFADFGRVAGRVASAGARSMDGNSDTAISAQMESLRATDWRQLRDEDLRLLGLKIRTAREWIVRAAIDPGLRSDLAGATSGILSPTRRAELLNGLEGRDWSTVWNAVTLSDLYFLADRYLGRYPMDPWSSPTTAALRLAAAANRGERLHWLGSVAPTLSSCSHPHLQSLAPYEEYERYLTPERIGERAAEFKLYLADYLDRAGIPAAALGAVAEPLAIEVLRRLRMTDMYDWRSVVAALSGINDELLESVVQKP